MAHLNNWTFIAALEDMSKCPLSKEFLTHHLHYCFLFHVLSTKCEAWDRRDDEGEYFMWRCWTPFTPELVNIQFLTAAVSPSTGRRQQQQRERSRFITGENCNKTWNWNMNLVDTLCHTHTHTAPWPWCWASLYFVANEIFLKSTNIFVICK